MRALRAVPLLGLLLVTLMAPAWAQLPPVPTLPIPTPGGGGLAAVEVDVTETEGKVTVEGPRLFEVVVRYPSSAPANPTDANNQETVTIAVSGQPDGWTASVTPGSFKLSPGGQETVTLEVQVASDGADQGTLTVTATATSPLDPVAGQFPVPSNSTATASDVILLRRDESASRSVLEAVGDWIWVVLLGLVAAVVLAVALLSRGRRPAVALETGSHVNRVSPGGRVSVDVTVRNLTNKPDTVVFEVSAVPSGWAAFLPVPDLTLEPEAAQEMALVVIAPANAKHGEVQSILVSAASPRARNPATLAVDIEVGVPVTDRRRMPGK